MNVAMTIAGSDSGGGAGIQADLKTFHQFQVFGTSVVVAVTSQNTLGVTQVHTLPVSSIETQIQAVHSDLHPKAVKTGMLATSVIVEAVASCLQSCNIPNYVLDPVMVASSGDRLLEDDAVALVARLLIPMALLITPNSQEAGILTGSTIENQHDMAEAALKLQDMGACAVLIKGGHINGDKVTDLLRFESQSRLFSHERIDTTSTHGTGCTLSAAITAELANGRSIVDAVETGLNFVNRAIAAAPSLGAGHGPLNHFVSVE